MFNFSSEIHPFDFGLAFDNKRAAIKISPPLLIAQILRVDLTSTDIIISYSFQGPNYPWHIDGYDKLKAYGFAIHGCIDGWGRYDAYGHWFSFEF